MVSRISKGIVKTINALHPSKNPTSTSSFSIEGAGTAMTGGLPSEKNMRKMDDKTFYQLFTSGDVATLMSNGGHDLTKEQIDLVKKLAKQQSDDNMLQRQMQMATKKGYKESILTPLMAKMIAGSTGGQKSTSSNQKNDVPSNVQEKDVLTGPQKTSPVTQKNISKILKTINNSIDKNSVPEGANAEQILGGIYKLMVKIQVDDKLRWEMAKNQAEQKEIRTEKKHKEIIEALTILNFGKRKKMVSKKKKATEPSELSTGGKPKPAAKTEPTGTTPQTPATPAAKPATTPQTPSTPAAKPATTPTTPPATPTPRTTPTGTPKVTKQTPPKVSKQQKKVPDKPKKVETKPNTPTPPPKVSGTPPVSSVGKNAIKGGAAAAAVVASSAVSAEVLAAANITIAGETGHRGSLSDRVGQVVPNDPAPGITSYGMLGLNSGPNSQSIQSFVAENPQFGFKSKPATPEFDAEFRKVAATRAQEMYDAQLIWYEKHVYKPTVKLLSNSGISDSIAKDPRVIAYMSDRYDQMNAVGLKRALEHSKNSTTSLEFIDKISEYDLSTIEKSFGTAISNAKDPKRFIEGLKARILKRQKMSGEIGVPPPAIQPNEIKLGESSIENKELHNSLNSTKVASSTINQNNINMIQKQSSATPNEKYDDRSAYERKSRTV
jgi:hypothetical protein